MTSVTTKTLLGDWEEVYSVQKVTAAWGDEVAGFHNDATYYQTFGKSPEGGYFVKVKMGEGNDLNCASCDGVWKATRSWGQPWRVEKLKNVVLEYEPSDEMAGRTARCRKIEVYSLKETREIVDTHILWGNAIEIVKCLRDGLSSKADEKYKDLCLGIILEHFSYIDKHLDLLPQDSCPTYKEILHHLARKEENDGESSEEEESGSESEEEEVEVVCCKKKVKTEDVVRSSEGTNLCKDCWT